jgi:hypothetical protein
MKKKLACRRVRISVSEFEFEFGELYTLFQNSNSPNIREYEFEFELGELFPTPGYPTKGRRSSLPLHPPSGYGIRWVVEERLGASTNTY